MILIFTLQELYMLVNAKAYVTVNSSGKRLRLKKQMDKVEIGEGKCFELIQTHIDFGQNLCPAFLLEFVASVFVRYGDSNSS